MEWTGYVRDYSNGRCGEGGRRALTIELPLVNLDLVKTQLCQRVVYWSGLAAECILIRFTSATNRKCDIFLTQRCMLRG